MRVGDPRRILAAVIRTSGRAVGAAAGMAVQVVLPPVCPITGEMVDRVGHVSPRAWRDLEFISAPVCARCGRPFAYDVGADAVCAPCARAEPPFTSLRAVFAYTDASARLILRIKYGDQTDGLKHFALWMAGCADRAAKRCDFLVPVPLHYLRLVRRQFNQSALLARALAPHVAGRYEPRLLRRIRRTPPQKGLTGQERWQNVKDAFRVAEGAQDRLKGKSVLLIDDVYTTGATVRACCAALRRAGADQIHVLVLARVVGEETLPI